MVSATMKSAISE